MRIISGKFRSRKINAPPVSQYEKNNIIRPTSDRARETLFDVLSNYINFEQMNCLDLFAGTGAFGFESLSRGAKRAAFVDRTFISIKLIRKTSEELELGQLVSLYRYDSLRFLSEFPGNYELIFADPPYDYEKNEKLVMLVLERNPGCFVLETGRDIKIEYNSEIYELLKRRSGSAHFNIFLKKD